MTVLCCMFCVPPEYYDQSRVSRAGRESDFYLFDGSGKSYRCEVKLLGKGNPESADAAFARDAKIFIADTISDKMKQELEKAEILWMEMRGAQDWNQFADILKKLGIPYERIKPGQEEERLIKSLDTVFSKHI